MSLPCAARHKLFGKYSTRDCSGRCLDDERRDVNSKITSEKREHSKGKPWARIPNGRGRFLEAFHWSEPSGPLF